MLPSSLSDSFCGLGSYKPPTCEALSCCAPCPAGSFCVAADANGTSTPCPAYYYSSEGAGICCGAGAFRRANNKACTNCTAGNYCPVGSSAPTAPLPCLAGSWSSTLATACTLCSAGKYNPSSKAEVEGACLTCEDDEYSASGAAVCTGCPFVSPPRPPHSASLPLLLPRSLSHPITPPPPLATLCRHKTVREGRGVELWLALH